MKKYLSVFFIILLFVVSCGKTDDEKNKEQKNKQNNQNTSVKRKKIDRLEPKSFIELTIDLIKEKIKWQLEWHKYIQKKQSEYFASYGLSEDKFNRFSQNNHKSIQKFLKKNPHYNKKYMDVMQKQRLYNRQ